MIVVHGLGRSELDRAAPEPVIFGAGGRSLVVIAVLSFTDRDAAGGQTRIVTHRVVEVLPGPAFVTKGDANRTNDPAPVAAQDVHGVLWYDVPYVGGLRDRLVSPAGLAVAGGIVLLAIALALLAPKHAKGR